MGDLLLQNNRRLQGITQVSCPFWRVDQVITERIQEAVQNGVITQVEADRIHEWWKNRPDGLQKLLGNMRGHWGGMRGFQK